MQAEILRTLEALGKIYIHLLEVKGCRRSYLVGGAIRDILIGRKPVDFDLAVSGSGIEFARQFARKIRAKFVLLSEADDEARVIYRRKITFDFNGFGDSPMETDLARRDFTINAIATELPAVNKIIDLFGGLSDLQLKIIRPVSQQSLRLDPLRLLRAIRLALELKFTVHSSVYDQASGISLKEIAAERIGMEVLRILESTGSCPYLKKLHQLGRLSEIIPELAPLLADEELWQHTLRTCDKIDELLANPGFFSRFEPEWQAYFDPFPYRRALLKLAGLLHDIAKPHTRFKSNTGQVHFYGHDNLGARLAMTVGYNRLRLSRNQVRMVRTLVKEHMRLHLLATAPELTDRAIRRYFRDLGAEAFGLMILCYADGYATAGRTAHLEETITRMINQKRQEDTKTKIKRLVTGDDLIAVGMKPGPAFRVILQELEDLQIEGKITSKEQGLEYLKTHLTTETKK
ncbi:MAG: HD domain-containing protein [bacterium]